MSVLGHVFEAAGLTTVAIALVREHAEKVKPPRALFVPFPYGFPLGKPDEPEFQHHVIAATLDLLKQPSGPVLVDFEDEIPGELPQASAIESSPEALEQNPADEVTAIRAFYERWVEEHQGRTAVGLSGVPQRRFRGTVRFLEAYAKNGHNGDADMKERPGDVSKPQFLRYCADDLKAFYYEARMCQRPQSTDSEMHTWFWGETAVGKLIKSVAEKMNETDDPELKSFAYGLAR